MEYFVQLQFEFNMANNKKFYVFSYGSNLLFRRIYERVSTVKIMNKCLLKGYKLAFNKLSKDGSTKANIVATGKASDGVWGMAHSIDYEQKSMLDFYEGLGYGYDLHEITSHLDINVRPVFAYIATDPKYLFDGKPFTWYHKLVHLGAQENDFPAYYINFIKSIKSEQDSDAERVAKIAHLLS